MSKHKGLYASIILCQLFCIRSYISGEIFRTDVSAPSGN